MIAPSAAVRGGESSPRKDCPRRAATDTSSIEEPSFDAGPSFSPGPSPSCAGAARPERALPSLRENLEAVQVYLARLEAAPFIGVAIGAGMNKRLTGRVGRKALAGLELGAEMRDGSAPVSTQEPS